jgi:hypothetical protein
VLTSGLGIFVVEIEYDRGVILLDVRSSDRAILVAPATATTTTTATAGAPAITGLAIGWRFYRRGNDGDRRARRRDHRYGRDFRLFDFRRPRRRGALGLLLARWLCLVPGCRLPRFLRCALVAPLLVRLALRARGLPTAAAVAGLAALPLPRTVVVRRSSCRRGACGRGRCGGRGRWRLEEVHQSRKEAWPCRRCRHRWL